MTSKEDKHDTLFAIASLGSDDEDPVVMRLRVRAARKAVAERRRSSAHKLPSSNGDSHTQTGGEEGSILAGATHVVDTQDTHAPANLLAEAKGHVDTQIRLASASNFSDHRWHETQKPTVAESSSTGGQDLLDTQALRAPGGFLRDPMLALYVDVLEDIERVRVANDNRVRQLTRTEADSDGEHRGFGLTEDHPDVARLIASVKLLHCGSHKYPEKLRGCCQEHDAIRNLEIAMKRHPLYPFVARHHGIGPKQFARLLGAIGDPYWNDLHDRPRRVSDLWAYCGFHVIRTSGGHTTTEAQAFRSAGAQPHTGSQGSSDTQSPAAPGVAPKRRRGQKSNWSEVARIRVWVIASAMPKFPGGHYEQVYRQAREKYAEATHYVDCIRCGTTGKPAPTGTPLSPGHQHARAVRIVAKEILKDLWIEARNLYHPEEKAVDAQV
jgi:hypothetical protein